MRKVKVQGILHTLARSGLPPCSHQLQDMLSWQGCPCCLCKLQGPQHALVDAWQLHASASLGQGQRWFDSVGARGAVTFPAQHIHIFYLCAGRLSLKSQLWVKSKLLQQAAIWLSTATCGVQAASL